MLTTLSLHAMAQSANDDWPFNSTTSAYGPVFSNVQSDGRILIGGNFTGDNDMLRNHDEWLKDAVRPDADLNPLGWWASGSINTTAVPSEGQILIRGAMTDHNATGRNRDALSEIFCVNPDNPGIISGNQINPASNDPAIFTSNSAASGHTGTLEYQWHSSIKGNDLFEFEPIAGANSETYDAGVLTQTTWFRRLARVSCQGTWVGSNVLQVTITVPQTWTGSVSTDWNNPSNWDPSGVPTLSSKVTIPSSGRPPVLTAPAKIFELTLATGAVLNLSTRTLINTAPDLINNGTIIGTTGNIQLSQDGYPPYYHQTISGTGSISSLDINNNNGVIISSGMLTITGRLSVNFGILTTGTTGGNLTLKSDATGTARVNGSGVAYINGPVTTQRHLTVTTHSLRTGRAWRMVSIPVTGTGTLRDFFMAGRNGANLTSSGDRDAQPAHLGTVIVGHNYANVGDATTTAGFDWVGVPNQVSSLRRYVANSSGGSFASEQVPSMSTTYSSADQGYAVFVRGDRKWNHTDPNTVLPTTLQATGTLKQGDQPVTIPAITSAGYVLVGNPYMSLLDMEKVFADNSNIIEPVVYLWDANIDGSFNQGGYRAIARNTGSTNPTTASGWTSTPVSASLNPHQYIESGVAFFVKPKSSGGTLSIKESHKVSGTPGIQPLGTSENGLARLFVNLEVKDTGDSRRLVDGVVAFFDDSYKVSLEDAVDIRSMSNMGASPMGWRQAGERLAMQGRPWPVDSTLMSMQLDTRSLGTAAYLLRVIPDGLKREGFTAWLKDGYLKQQVALDLEGETLYEFRRTGDAGVDSGRFEILYRKMATAATASPEPASDMRGGLRLYPNPSKYGDARLSLRGMPAGTYHVQVMDVLGRVLGNNKLQHPEGGGSYRLPKWGKPSTGRYVVRVTNQDGQAHTLQLIVE